MRITRFAALLLSVDFLDELVWGAPMVGAPGIRETFGIDYATSGGVLFTIPLLLSMVLEPPVFVLADRYGKKRFVCGGLAMMAVLYLAAGLAPTFTTFAAALAFTAATSGWGVSLAQAALMDVSGALGDQVSPSRILHDPCDYVDLGSSRFKNQVLYSALIRT